MRKILQGETNWAEVSDFNAYDEVAAINDGLGFISNDLRRIQDELKALYWAIRDLKGEPEIYIEGTFTKIEVKDENE